MKLVSWLSKLLACAVASVALTTAATAAFAASGPVKNILLVHGAFVDGSSWSKVIPILQAKGYNVTAVQLPLTSLTDDAATTARALARISGPVILVGHSWGGVVITEAGTDPKVAGLVYVAAFAPDQGEAVGALGQKYPPPPALAAPVVDDKGFMTLTADAFKKFGSDLPEREAYAAAATQGPIAASAFGAQVSGTAWKTKPSWYIVSTLDQAIAPDEERFFAKRMNATTTELKASHVSMLSQPKAVAAVIMDAAEKSGASGQAAGH